LVLKLTNLAYNFEIIVMTAKVAGAHTNISFWYFKLIFWVVKNITVLCCDPLVMTNEIKFRRGGLIICELCLNSLVMRRNGKLGKCGFWIRSELLFNFQCSMKGTRWHGKEMTWYFKSFQDTQVVAGVGEPTLLSAAPCYHLFKQILMSGYFYELLNASPVWALFYLCAQSHFLIHILNIGEHIYKNRLLSM